MYHYPTILVARDDGLDCRLVQSLQQNGFHVLEADDWDHLFDVVRVHSRRIHLLLLDAKNMYVYVPILKAHRFWLQILFVEKQVGPARREPGGRQGWPDRGLLPEPPAAGGDHLRLPSCCPQLRFAPRS